MSLYPALFQRVIFPALDLVNRTRVSRALSELDESQWFPLDRLRELQHRKLDEVLTWTRLHSGFYRRFWREADESRRLPSEYPQLHGLPIVTKNDVRKAVGEFPEPAFRGRVITVKTSGSTGEPMTHFRSARQESLFWALRFRMWKWAGYVPGEPYLTLNLNPRTAWAKKLQDVLFRCSYHGFNANSHDVERVLRDLRRQRIRHLVGYGSSLYLLCQAMQELGAENPGVETVLSTGDTLFPSYRRQIEKTFGVGVVDYYGAGGEGFHLASQCERRGRYHQHIENSIIEVLADGRPARPGEPGEIVVTQLDNLAMPLIRYATQDLATPAPEEESCPCGRQLPLLEGVEGRVPDIVFAPDGSALVVHFFTILFEHLQGIRQFQILQSERDRITARIVPAREYERPATEKHITAAIAEATHASLEVDFDYVDEIPLSRSNKRRFVISKVLSAPFATGRDLSGSPDNASWRSGPAPS